MLAARIDARAVWLIACLNNMNTQEEDEPMIAKVPNSQSVAQGTPTIEQERAEARREQLDAYIAQHRGEADAHNAVIKARVAKSRQAALDAIATLDSAE